MNIDFHFDFLSPYAYLAWTQIHDLAARHGATVKPVPTLFAALLAHGGTKGPAEIPAKRAYVFLDTLRTARRLGVPLVPPPAHPFHPLLALRVCSSLGGEAQRRAIDALFAAAWGGQGGCDTETRVEVALSRAGLDGAALVALGADDAAKALLRAQTEAAIANGVFGVPTMRTGSSRTSLFFGLDSFPALEAQLRGEDYVSEEDIPAWSALPVGVSHI
jgi:2-hydroxychromene-2-carboxylate isomerase